MVDRPIDNPLDVHLTPTWAVRALVPHLPFIARQGTVIDAGAGAGAICSVLADEGINVLAVEARAEMAEFANVELPGMPWVVGDFLDLDLRLPPAVGVVMNPPYGGRHDTAAQFVRRALDLVRPQGGFVAALLRLNWLCGGQVSHGRGDWLRREMPEEVLALDRRPSFSGFQGRTDATDYAWMIWGAVPSSTSRFRLIRCRGNLGAGGDRCTMTATQHAPTAPNGSK